MALRPEEIQMILRAQDRTRDAFASVQRNMDRMESGSRKLVGGLRTLTGIGAFAYIASEAGAAAQAIVGGIAEIEKYNKALEISTGGGVAFAQAQSDIQRQLNGSLSTTVQLTQAYQKMANLGITPTLERMRAFEQVAIGSGRSLDQFIEAVADASTGEFERLKEFGIKARDQGDEIAFTFRGMTTVVEESSDAIVGYLERIGNVEYAGSVAAQLDTIGGSSANAAKEVSRLWNALVGASGAGGALSSLMNEVAEAAQEFRLSIGGAPEGLAEIEERVQFLKRELSQHDERTLFDNILNPGEWAAAAARAKVYGDQLDELLPKYEQLRLANQYEVYGASRIQSLAQIAAAEQKLVDERAALTDKIDGQAEKRIAALQREIATFGDSSQAARIYYEIQNGAYKDASASVQESVLGLARQLDALKAGEKSAQEKLKAEQEFQRLVDRSSPIRRVAADYEAANELIARYNESRAAEEQATLEQRAAVYEHFGDRIADSISKNIKIGGIEGLDQLDAAHAARLARLQELSTQQLFNEQAINEARLDLVESFEAKKKAIEDRIADETRKKADELLRQVNQLSALGQSPFDQLRSETADQRSLINQALPEKDDYAYRAELLRKVEADHQTKLDRLVAGGYQDRRAFAEASTKAQAQHVLGVLGGLTSGIAQENRAAFEIQKAAAIGNAIVSTHAGVTKALEAYPPPLSGIMAAVQLAAGLKQIQAIKNTSFGKKSASTTSVGGGSAGGGAQTQGDTIANAQAGGSSSRAAGAQYNVTIQSIDTRSGMQALAQWQRQANEQNLVDDDGQMVDFRYGT